MVTVCINFCILTTCLLESQSQEAFKLHSSNKSLSHVFIQINLLMQFIMHRTCRESHYCIKYTNNTRFYVHIHNLFLKIKVVICTRVTNKNEPNSFYKTFPSKFVDENNINVGINISWY